jgi:genetic interactor of prohibitins 3, mitochondrial
MSKGVRLAGRVVRQCGVPVADLPVFLCPGLLRFPSVQPNRRPQESRRTPYQAQQIHITSIASKSSGTLPAVLAPLLERLPQQCAGCGALSQTVDKEAPGFYTPTRKSIRQYLEGTPSSMKSAEDEIVKAALENAVSIETGINLGDFTAFSKHTNFCELNLLLTFVQPKVQSHRFVIDATN